MKQPRNLIATRFIFQPLMLAALMLACQGMAYNNEVIVDPGTRLSNVGLLVEWATTGDLESWTGSNVTGLAATNGCLAGTDATTGADAYVNRTVMATGPDLDLGFNDYLQIRLKLPASYSNDVRIEFGTTVKTGFATDRRFTIPSTSLVKDGAFHTYRVDLGLEVWWRDTLRDLRVTPLLSSTGDFEIAYIEIGDVAGTAPALNLNTNFKSPLTASNTSRLQGKHVCVWWDTNNTSFTSTHARRAVRMCEETYQVLCNKLGYLSPVYEFDNTNSTPYKVNFITWYDGFWAGGYNNRPHLNVGVSGLADEGWGNPAPHEFAHCVQMAQPGRLVGGHWESHANYLRAERNLHFYAFVNGVGLDNLTGNSNYRPDHKRHIYADQRYYLSLDDYGTGFGLPPNYAAVMWRDGARDKTIIEKLAASLPANVSARDVAAECMKRWPLLDFVEKTRIRSQHWGSTTAKAEHFWRQGSTLYPQQDKANWWRVPFERAPDKWSYMCHELTASVGTQVTVEVRPLDVTGTIEDLRWCLAAVTSSDDVRYTPVMAPGTTNMTLVTGETKLFLIVTATPGSTPLNLESFYNTKPTDKNGDRLRYPYEVRLVNTTPDTQRLALSNPSGYTLHPNGGGVVGPSATVASTAYVGPNAKVLDSARVLNTARIEDYAIVQDSALVQGTAVVSGRARVHDTAVVQNAARVRDRAEVRGNSRVEDRALVMGYACVENTVVQDDAIVRGCAFPFGGTLGDTAIADHDYSMAYTLTNGVHFGHIPWDDWFFDNYAGTLCKPRGLFASYRTEETSGQAWWDEYGAQHALLRGSPTRSNDTFFNSSPVLVLDGTDDYVAFDRSVADMVRFSFTGWFKPSRAIGTEEPLLFLGANTNKALTLSRLTTGKARLSIANGTTTCLLNSTNTLAQNSWSHLGITLDGSTAKLYVNGKLEASASTSLTPLSILATNDVLSLQANYAGRDWAGALFKGSLEDLRFFSVALTAAEMREAYHLKGTLQGLYSPSAPKDFNGTSSMAQSGIRNGRTRTLVAWVKPHTSSDVSNYEAVFDSDDERNAPQGSGMGLDNGKWIVRLDGLGNWNTGISAPLNQWQHIALTFNGTSASFFVNGALAASKTYTGPTYDSEAAGKCYRIGYSQTTTDTASRQYFDGLILNAQVHDKALTASQLVFDMDRDGVNDNVEADFGTDPIDPASTPPQYAIAGDVTDLSEHPITNATLSIATSTNFEQQSTFTVKSDIAGHYSRLVTPGTWYVKAAATGFTPSTNHIVVITASAATNTHFQLEVPNLPAPSGLLATNVTYTQVQLLWADEATAELGYRIERRLTDSISWISLTNMQANATQFVDTTMTEGRMYDYRITPYNATGFGASSFITVEIPSISMFLLPFVETFEPESEIMANVADLLHGQHGWSCDPTNAAIVQTEILYQGDQAGAITNGTLSHYFIAPGTSRVWVDFVMQAQRAVDSDLFPPAEGSSTAFYFSHEGKIVAQHGSAWITQNSFSFSNNEWVRLTMKVDYTTRKWSLYAMPANGGRTSSSCVAVNLDFVTGSTNTSPTEFRLTLNHENQTCFDNFLVTDEALSGIPKHIPRGTLLLIQ
jgi:hypothetical protein